MNLHPYMVEAIFLRLHPDDRLEKDGKVFWFCVKTQKYLWKYLPSSPSHKSRPNIYEARGLLQWWKRYVDLCGGSGSHANT